MVKLKLKYKLMQLFLITSLLPLIIMVFITIVFLDRMAINDAHQRIDNNLNIALSIYQSTLDNLKYVVRDLNRRVFTLIEEDQLDLLRNEFVRVVKRNNLDFFVITDAGGRVIVSMSDPQLEGKDLSRDTFVRRAMRGQLSVSTEILSDGELEKLGLMGRARIPNMQEVQGMVIEATMPVINKNEIIIGTMSAGYLLNNNTNKIILGDIKKSTDLVANIFLGNQRICSTMPSLKGENIIGSRLDPEKAKWILEKGERYISRMQVGGNWYLCGYTPIYNDSKKIIGILSIGIPEKNIFALRDKLIKIFTLAVCLSIILSMLFGIFKGEKIVKSIQKLRRGIEAFGRGDYSHRIEIRSKDEIEELADFFNQTMVQLMRTKQQLEVYARNVQTLESRVSQSNTQLQAAEKQLVEYERMAAMGRMATVLSHELRNVFAEIQTGSYNLKAKVGKDHPQFVDYLKSIEEGLSHANQILSDVLKFSYPKKLIFSEVDINYLINDLLSFPSLQEQFKNNNIKIIKNLGSDLPKINVDGLQIREVFLNLIVNAVQAMPRGGKITVLTENDQGLLRVKVADTGSGMSRETLNSLFTPFFTTKSRGLGLGLCISKAIVEEHGGHIQVHSELEHGSTFIVSLPVRDITPKP
jgi:two-component system NtrC family sensor kinase